MASAPLPPEAWRRAGAVLLVGCYELGRQPFSLASPWAQLEAAGFGVAACDTAVAPLDPEAVRRARLVAVSVPMHTALRLGVALAADVRRVAPEAHVCLYGLYAALNAEHLLVSGSADSVAGGEVEEALVALARVLAAGDPGRVPGVTRDPKDLVARAGARMAPPVLRKLSFVRPRRDRLPPLSRYATFFGPTPGERRMVGYVEASRGCLHTCRHCPVTPVYQGRFFVVPREIVLADAEQQIAAGARHITFGDPDFLNGPGHGMAVARALHDRHPDVTFDVTAKIEHLRAQGSLLAELGRLGCAFVVTAVESLSDRVLAALDKGHSRADVFDVLGLAREACVPLRPSFVPFSPWETLDGYVELVDWIVGEGLVDHVEPIQLAIRLLVPPASALLADGEPDWLGPLAPGDFGHGWRHPDPRMDALHGQICRVVEEGARDDPADVILRIRALAYAALGREAPSLSLPTRRFVPRLSEAWFCCAEPSAELVANLRAG
jgi:hypothetical protein